MPPDSAQNGHLPPTPKASTTASHTPPDLSPVYVLATGSQLPGKPVTNADIIRNASLPIEEDWVVNKIRIDTRYVSRLYSEKEHRYLVQAQPGCKNSELSAQAVQTALKSIGMPASALDMIIHTSCTPDYPIPPTSALVQDILGVNGLITMDIRSACCGSSQGLVTAMQYLQTHKVSTVAIVSCDTGSMFGLLDATDSHWEKSHAVNAVMIGDAAACIILSRTPGPFVIEDAQIGSIGVGQKAGMSLLAGGSCHPLCQETLDSGRGYFTHNFRDVLVHGPKLYVKAIDAILVNNAITLDDIDIIVPHQANGRVPELADKMGLPSKKLFCNFSKYGNTANASLFLSLDEIHRQRRMKDGESVLLLAAESTKWLYGGTLLRKVSSDESADFSTAAVAASSRSQSKSAYSSRVKLALWLIFSPLVMFFASLALQFSAPSSSRKKKSEKKA